MKKINKEEYFKKINEILNQFLNMDFSSNEKENESIYLLELATLKLKFKDELKEEKLNLEFKDFIRILSEIEIIKDNIKILEEAIDYIEYLEKNFNIIDEKNDLEKSESGLSFDEQLREFSIQVDNFVKENSPKENKIEEENIDKIIDDAFKIDDNEFDIDQILNNIDDNQEEENSSIDLDAVLKKIELEYDLDNAEDITNEKLVESNRDLLEEDLLAKHGRQLIEDEIKKIDEELNEKESSSKYDFSGIKILSDEVDKLKKEMEEELENSEEENKNDMSKFINNQISMSNNSNDSVIDIFDNIKSEIIKVIENQMINNDLLNDDDINDVTLIDIITSINTYQQKEKAETFVVSQSDIESISKVKVNELKNLLITGSIMSLLKGKKIGKTDLIRIFGKEKTEKYIKQSELNDVEIQDFKVKDNIEEEIKVNVMCKNIIHEIDKIFEDKKLYFQNIFSLKSEFVAPEITEFKQWINSLNYTDNKNKKI